jgi:hypothetical protein
LSRALQYLREILTLVGEDRRKLPALVVLFLGVSLLDLAGLGLIAPYIALVMNPEALLEGRLGELLFSLGGPTDRETLLLGLSGLLVVLYLVAQSGSFASALPIIALYAFAGYRFMSALSKKH